MKTEVDKVSIYAVKNVIGDDKKIADALPSIVISRRTSINDKTVLMKFFCAPSFSRECTLQFNEG